jgi:hypothetical protein
VGGSSEVGAANAGGQTAVAGLRGTAQRVVGKPGVVFERRPQPPEGLVPFRKARVGHGPSGYVEQGEGAG